MLTLPDIRELRVVFPEGEDPIISLEFSLPNGAGRYRQAQMGKFDDAITLPNGEKTTVSELIEAVFCRILEARIRTPFLPAETAPPGTVREEEVWAGGKLTRRSISPGHKDFAQLRDLITAHLTGLPGLDPTSRIIFAGLSRKGGLYTDDELNVYYGSAPPPELLAYFKVPDPARYNQTYFGVKARLHTGEKALRLLDMDVQDYVPLPVPPPVKLTDLRYGIARHFGYNENLADVYFECDDSSIVDGWCTSLSVPPPAPPSKNGNTYGVTWDVGTKQVVKVKLYVWDAQYIEFSSKYHSIWASQMLQRWKRSGFDLR